MIAPKHFILYQSNSLSWKGKFFSHFVEIIFGRFFLLIDLLAGPCAHVFPSSSAEGKIRLQLPRQPIPWRPSWNCRIPDDSLDE